MPSGKIQEIIMIKNNLYGREIYAYSTIISSVVKLLSDAGDDTKFTAYCLHTDTVPRPYLIFQDMSKRGYKSLSRKDQLNFDLALPVIVKLAKLHASSAVLYERNPSKMDLYLEGSISPNPERQDFLVHYRNCAFTLGDVAEKNWGNEWKGTAQKLKDLSKKIIQCGYDLYTRDDNDFNVFNHNDLWIPNILYQMDEYEMMVNDVVFVDFQMPFFGSPGIDLNFFLYGSLSESARTSFLKKLVRIYHDTLTETLVKLEYSKKLPTLHDIHMAMLKKGFNCVLAAIAEVPLLVYDDQENLHMDKVLEDSESAQEFRFNLFDNPQYRPFIQRLLVEFDDMGYLD